MQPTLTQNTNITPEGTFASLGFSVVSRDEALAAAAKVVTATRPKPSPRKKRIRRAKIPLRSIQNCRPQPTPPTTPPPPSIVIEENHGVAPSSDRDSDDSEGEENSSECSCRRQCVVECSTDSSRIRKPAHLPIMDATAMGPSCQLSWNGVDYDQCPMTECLLDVTDMDDQSLLSIDMSPKVKHIQSTGTGESGIYREGNMIHVVHHCPGLQTVQLRNFRSRNLLLALLSSCPLLEHVQMFGNYSDHDPLPLWALAELPDWAPNLVELSMSWTGNRPFHETPMEMEGLGIALDTLANARPSLLIVIFEIGLRSNAVVWARVPSWFGLEQFKRWATTTSTTVFDDRRIEEPTPFVSNWA